VQLSQSRSYIIVSPEPHIKKEAVLPHCLPQVINEILFLVVAGLLSPETLLPGHFTVDQLSMLITQLISVHVDHSVDKVLM
jgi:hypothetical protein